MKQKLRNRLNRISLRNQLAALVITAFTIIIFLIVIYNYDRNRKAIKNNQISISTTLLQSEIQNLDAYFTEIDRYSLLLRHDESFMQIISSKKEMDYSEQTAVQILLRNNYYSRNDLLSYRLYLLRKSENYEINANGHKVQSFYDGFAKDLPDYNNFTKGRYYKSIQASSNTETFMTFYRTIIRIQDQEPLAIVELSFDTSFIDSLIQTHQAPYDFFCIINQNNKLLYTNNTAAMNTSVIRTCLANISQTQKNHFTVPINHEDFLVVYAASQKHGYTLLHLKQLSELDKQLADTRNISLLIGFISITIATALVTIFIQLVTKPLSALSHRFRRVGSGNFTTTTDIGGSLEITNLAENFNSMIYQIDELIKKNYISEINEKTAQLIALQAQINPHFLYNTLQAISAEAIVNHQSKINSMITALASMLRYTIKDGDFVQLSQEVKHVNDYLLLQQARFGEHLSYEMNIQENTQELLIPKISIQTLVENSIIHGMTGNVTDIYITIESYIERDWLMIIVTDNGNGIDPERLDELNKIKSANQHTEIGLMNLKSRLRLLYKIPASLYITSIIGYRTTVTLKIPIVKENKDV